MRGATPLHPAHGEARPRRSETHMSARRREAPEGEGDEGKCDRWRCRRMPRGGLWGGICAPPGDRARRRISRRGRAAQPTEEEAIAAVRRHRLFTGTSLSMRRSSSVIVRRWCRPGVTHDAVHDGHDQGERHAPEPAGRLCSRQRSVGSGRLVGDQAAISPPVLGGR